MFNEEGGACASRCALSNGRKARLSSFENFAARRDGTRKYRDERSWCVLAFVASHSSVLFLVSVTPHSAIFKHDAAAIAPASLILLYGF